MNNTKYNTNDVKKRASTKLGIRFGTGGELNGWYYLNGLKATRITIPKGRKPIPPKTYKSMARQLKLTIPQFDDLLDCPLKKEAYDKILKSNV